MPSQPLNVFISYSHNDEDRPLLDQLLAHLAPLQQTENPVIKTWDDAHILPGDPWDDEIKQNLLQADIVLLLVSADFNNSRYIQEIELKESVQRHKKGECTIAPIFLRPCEFKGMLYEEMEMLPKLPENQKLKAITEWQNRDTAFTEIVKRLRELIEALRQQKNVKPAAVPVGAVAWDDPWHLFFNKRSPKKDLRLQDTVNCNRLVHYPKFEQHFIDNKAKPGNLVYFFTACDSQNPESLAKRLAYWYDEDFDPTFFRPDEEKRKDELKFLDLPLEKKEETTWGKFWELFKKKILQQEIDFEEFVKDPASTLSIVENTRLLLSFQISESDLLEYKANKHIRYILGQFARLPADFQKFVFCFVFHLPDVHEFRKKDCAYLLQLLEELATPSEQDPQWAAGLHLSCLPAVPVADLKVWWNARFDPAHFPDFNSEIKKRVLPDKTDACNQHGRFDMYTVEEMQYAAYTFTRDKKLT